MHIDLIHAYTMFKKDVHSISHNEPLLFVHGPPVFIRVAVTDEESTSVFVPNGEEHEDPSEAVQNVVTPNLSVLRKIKHLGGTFQRQVYKPLQFIIGEETLLGAIEKVDEDTIFIDVHGEDDLIVAVEISTIEEVLWRGKPFPES